MNQWNCTMNQPKTIIIYQTETAVPYQTESNTIYQQETGYTDSVQQAVDEAAVNNVQLTELSTLNSSASGKSGASVKMETGPGSTMDNEGQSLVYVCNEFNISNIEGGEIATADNIQPVPNGVGSDSFNINFNDVQMESSTIVCDSAQPVSLDTDFDAAKSQFICTDYDAPNEQEDAINEDEDFSHHRSEASAALKAITLARRDLEEEIQRRAVKIKEQQIELNRLMRELREVKLLERNELKKLKLIDTRSTSDDGDVARPIIGAKPVSYTLIRGKRYNAVLYAVQSGHVYQSKGNLYLRCCLWKHKDAHCQGLAKIAFEGYLVERREHNHTVDHPDLLRRRLLNQVRNAVRDDETCRSVKEIFNDVVSQSPHASLLDFVSIMNTLRKDQRRKDESTLVEDMFKKSALSRCLTQVRSSRSYRMSRLSKRSREDSDESDDSDEAEGGEPACTRSRAAEGVSTRSSAGQRTISEPPTVEPSPVNEEVPPPVAPPLSGSPPPAPAAQEAAGAAAAAEVPSESSCARMLGVAAPEFRRQLAFMLRDSDGHDLAIAFTAARVTAAARSSTGYTIQLDSSSKLCPPVGGVFCRLLLVSFSVGGQQRPGFLVLLRDVGRPVLGEVFRTVRRRLGSTQPDQVVCVSDPALLAAAGDSWPGATVSCSLSQFCRDLLSKVVGEDLSAQFSSWFPVRNWITMLLAVPFLPPPQMADALEKLKSVIPKDVDARTRQCLRQLNVYVLEEWLWKLGAAKLSAFGRPPADELDTVQFIGDLQSRYREFRSAAGLTAVSRGADSGFWPFVLAVNEMLQGADGALDWDEPGPLCWPNVRLLEPLVTRQAANLNSRQTSAVSFLKTVGSQLVAEGIPPGTGINEGDAAASDDADADPDSGTTGDVEPDVPSELSGRAAIRIRTGESSDSSGGGPNRSLFSRVDASRRSSAAAAAARTILVQKDSVTGSRSAAAGRVGSTSSVRGATVGSGSWSALREVRIKLERIRRDQLPPPRRSDRPRPGSAGGAYRQETEADPLQLPQDAGTSSGRRHRTVRSAGGD